MTEAAITCETGFTLSGEAVLVCDGQGTWDQSTAQCGKERHLISQQNGCYIFMPHTIGGGDI